MLARLVAFALLVIALTVAAVDRVADRIGDLPAHVAARPHMTLVFDDTNLFRVDRFSNKTGTANGSDGNPSGQLAGCGSLFAPQPISSCK